MKKIMLVVLAVLMLTFAAVSAQETETVVKLNWEDFAEVAVELDSDAQFFYVGDTGLAMWIPTAFHDVELTQEDVDAGMVAFLATEDADAFVTIMFMDLKGSTFDDVYANILADSTYTEVDKGVVNGLPAITYVYEEGDTMTLALINDEGGVLQFMFSPKSNEGFALVASIMMASIQIAE
jgi:hypothetical protein